MRPRIASTSRQIADDLMAAALVDDDGRPIAHVEADPAERARAAEKYEQAAEYYLRHARALASVTDADQDALPREADCPTPPPSWRARKSAA